MDGRFLVLFFKKEQPAGLVSGRAQLKKSKRFFLKKEAKTSIHCSVDTACRFQQHPALRGSGDGCRQGWLITLRPKLPPSLARWRRR
jgi:hypothetical protein